MSGGRILVVGDVMRDIVVRPMGAIRPGTDQAAHIRCHPGGSGANQALWLAHCGVPVRLVACVAAEDHAAEWRRLAAAGVEPALSAHPTLPTGSLIALIDADGERSFLTDRGANDDLDQTSDVDALLAGIDHLHVSGYALVGARTRRTVMALLEEARARRLAVSFDPGSAGFLAGLDVAAILHGFSGTALCIANGDEAAVLTGLADAEAQGRRLAACFDLVVVKRGAQGAVAIARDGRRWRAAARRVAVVDTIGAGDAFLAGFLHSRRGGASVPVALAAAVERGTAAVTRAGGAPPL